MADILRDEAEVLFRHIHPNYIDENGEPASDRFRPSERDQNMLSVDRSSIFTAEQSHALYTGNGRLAQAVFGLSVGEFCGERITCVADPTPETETAKANPAHALADFSGHDAKSQKIVAKRLQRLAVARGALYREEK